MKEESWILKAIEDAAMKRAHEHFEYSKVQTIRGMLEDPDFRLLGLSLAQIIELRAFYSKETGRPAEEIGK